MTYAVIGDVVASRRIGDLAGLDGGLRGLLAAVDARVPAVRPLALAVRDEFHGAYATAGGAVEACVRLRLLADAIVLPTIDGEDETIDVRVGIGQGEHLETAGASVTGSAWFHARDARDAAEHLPTKTKWPPSIRTVCRGDDPIAVAHLNAFLLCHDQLLARMDVRDRRALRGLLDGERQIDVANDLGVTQPAIARRIKERGALAVYRAIQILHDVEAATTSQGTTSQGTTSQGTTSQGTTS